MEAIITWSVEKAALISLTHVYQPTLKSDRAWGLRNLRLPNDAPPKLLNWFKCESKLKTTEK